MSAIGTLQKFNSHKNKKSNISLTSHIYHWTSSRESWLIVFFCKHQTSERQKHNKSLVTQRVDTKQSSPYWWRPAPARCRSSLWWSDSSRSFWSSLSATPRGSCRRSRSWSKADWLRAPFCNEEMMFDVAGNKAVSGQMLRSPSTSSCSQSKRRASIFVNCFIIFQSNGFV